MIKRVRLHDKDFELLIAQDKIIKAIANIAQEIDKDFEGQEPVFLCVLNGSFIFAADLVRILKINGTTSFVKITSYDSDKSSGTVRQLIGLNEDLNGKQVIVIEDVVDSGLTLKWLVEDLKTKGASSVHVAALLFKPEANEQKVKADYIGFNIKNDFVVGYGLDYNGLGRNLKDIYKLM